jgi:broad specificity phosphatase PhoE
VTTLLLARHGETDWNRDRRWQGHSDTPLNDVGREQAHALGRSLADVDLVGAYSSDLRRARETAEIAVAGRKLDVVTLPELRERSFGSWEGLHDDEVPRRFPDEYQQWDRGNGHGAHDAEPHEKVVARVEQALRRIAREHAGGTVLVVSHGGPLRVFQALAAGVDFVEHRRSIAGIENCGLLRCAIRDGVLTRLD